jgi:hypothetical protein
VVLDVVLVVAPVVGLDVMLWELDARPEEVELVGLEVVAGRLEVVVDCGVELGVPVLLVFGADVKE